ncbi:MAG: hydrolase [Sphingobium sp.]
MTVQAKGEGRFTITREDRVVLEAVEEMGPSLIARAVAWSEINSGSNNLAGLRTVAERLRPALAALGGKLESLPLDDVTTIDARGETITSPAGQCLHVQVRPDAPVQVALTGHYDTVFPADSAFQNVSQRPDSALNGPGIADMKGGISVMLGALEAFERHPLAANVGYQLLLSPDEETGSLGSAPVLAAIGKQCHVGMTYEPALSDGTLVSARKGSGNYHIVVRGRTAHAGREFAMGRNALATAARLAAALADLNGQRDELTVNIACIDGGGPLNTVPDLAVLRFNVRLPDLAAEAWMREKLSALVSAHQGDGISITVHGGISRPPKLFFPAQQNLFEDIRHVGALLDQSIEWRPSGGVCEGNNLLAQGLPGADTLGVRGGDIHSDQEFAWPESFIERASLSALILCKLASGEIDAIALRTQLEREMHAARP